MPSIIQKPIGRECGFTNQMYDPVWFCVHFTGGTPNLQSLYNYWLSQCGIGSNSHFGIERTDNQYAKAGDIWQFLPTYDGACANCCLESGHAPFLPDVNLNVRTISVECINPDSGNNGDMPQAQFDSLVYLIQTVCRDLGIPTDRYTEYWNDYETAHTWGDGGGGIIMHRDIAPHNRRMCPGTPYYSGQMDKIIAAVNGGTVSGGNYMSAWGSHSDEMAERMWNSWFDIENLSRSQMTPPQPPLSRPRTGTGIYNRWKERLVNDNNFLGPVLGEEYQFNSDDASYVVQQFTAGQYRLNKGTGEYDWVSSG